MNKAFLYIISLLISVNLVFALTITRDMPTTTNSGKNITITFNVQNADTTKLFTLKETIPSSFIISDWFVDGSKEAQTEILANTGNVYTWAFTPTISNPVISYSVSVPLTASGQHTFSAEWDGGSSQRILTLFSNLCGNGICDASENENNCASDCKTQQTTTDDSWPFSEKKNKKKGGNFFLIVVLLSLGGLIVFGYKKIKKKGIKSNFNFKPSKRIPMPKGKTKEYIETFASELPSFENEDSGQELPSLEEHKKEESEAVPVPLPKPVFLPKTKLKKEEKPAERKNSRKRDEVEGLFDNIFDKKNK